VKADHIEAVLEYLYADEVRSLATSEDTEFISHVLVVADQFLLIRLKVPYLYRCSIFLFFWLPDIPVTEAYVGLLKIFIHRRLNKDMNVLNSIHRSCC
jgi:hypothetical protein